MWGDILESKELYSKIVLRIREILGENLRAIIVFGSTIYMGRGNDIDLIVVTDEEMNMKDRLKLEYRLKQVLQRIVKDKIFNVHVFNLEEFERNLQPGSMLSGLALGYEVIYGEQIVEPLILNFLKQLSRGKYILHNRYGTWNLSYHARITYKLKLRKIIGKKEPKL